MAKYAMVVQSQAKEGRDDEYNEWYDTIHFGDICALPGVQSGRRFELEMAPIGPAGKRYLAIFEIETDDLQGFMAEMGKRASDGTMRQSDALDTDAVAMWFYRQRES
jgi:hypothetical protein